MKNLLALVLFCPIAAYAGTPKPKEVTLAVVAAPDDAILPVAYVVFPAEGRDQHVVNAINGKWSGSTLYPENGAEIPFTKGYTTEVYASGPGYQLTRASIVVGSHGLSQKISLTPIDYGDYRGAASPTASETRFSSPSIITTLGNRTSAVWKPSTTARTASASPVSSSRASSNASAPPTADPSTPTTT